MTVRKKSAIGFVVPKPPATPVVVSIIVCSVLIQVLLGNLSARNRTFVTGSDTSYVAMGGAEMMPQVQYAKNSYNVAYSVSGSAPAGALDITMLPQPVPASTVNLPSERKVVKNGNLELLVARVDSAVTDITNITVAANGFVENKYFSEYQKGVLTGIISVRVPNQYFDQAMEQFKAMAIRVESESSSAQDLSAEYVDLEAQLTALRAEEGQYLTIMKTAKDVKDVLLVSERLANVRARIEQTQGQLNYLSRQVGMSTISVTLHPEASPLDASVAWKPLVVVKNALKNAFVYLLDLVNLIIVMIIWSPILFLQLALIVLIVWVLWRVISWVFEMFTGIKVVNPFKK